MPCRTCPDALDRTAGIIRELAFFTPDLIGEAEADRLSAELVQLAGRVRERIRERDHARDHAPTP